MIRAGCAYCQNAGPEPGFIETDNNGPIAGCPVCNNQWNSEAAKRERQFDAAEAQRKRTAKNV